MVKQWRIQRKKYLYKKCNETKIVISIDKQHANFYGDNVITIVFILVTVIMTVLVVVDIMITNISIIIIFNIIMIVIIFIIIVVVTFDPPLRLGE